MGKVRFRAQVKFSNARQLRAAPRTEPNLDNRRAAVVDHEAVAASYLSDEGVSAVLSILVGGADAGQVEAHPVAAWRAHGRSLGHLSSDFHP